MHPEIDIIYFTYNRILYTRKTLPALIENAGVKFNLTIIDNGSTDGTVEYLKFIKRKYHDTVKEVIYNTKNMGLSLPTSLFWNKSSADYIGKVDNDTLTPPDWLATLLKAHQKTDKLGVIGGFHFNPGYVDLNALARRVIEVDGVTLVPDVYIGGCCYLMRRSLQQEQGYLNITPGKKTFGWTAYQCNIFQKGYINGYIHPLLFVEHFDDPLDENNLAFTAHAETSKISFSEKNTPLDRKQQLMWYINDYKRVEQGATLRAFMEKLAESQSVPPADNGG